MTGVLYTKFLAAATGIFQTGLVPCQGLDCTGCDIFKLLLNLLTLVWEGSFIVVTFMFMWGGVLYLKNNPDKARKVFTNTFIGIGIALFSWVIIGFALKLLAYKGSDKTATGDYLPWNQIVCVNTQATGATPGNLFKFIDMPNIVLPQSPGYSSEAAVCNIITGNNIQVNDGHCSCVTNNTCDQIIPRTRLNGMRQATISAVIDLKNNCESAGASCPVIITGGTEQGIHAEEGACTHVGGYKVDIRPNDNLDHYIINHYGNNGQPIGLRSSDSAKLYGDNYDLFAREGDHWDVTINCSRK